MPVGGFDGQSAGIVLRQTLPRPRTKRDLSSFSKAANDDSPQAFIVNHANTVVGYIGLGWYSVAKNAGTTGFDADAVSSATLNATGGKLEVIVEYAAGTFMAGLNASDPTLSSSYVGAASIDMDGVNAYLYDRFGNQVGGAHSMGGGNLYGKLSYDPATDTASLYLSTDRMTWGSALESTVVGAGTAQFYFDSSLASADARFNVLFQRVTTLALSPSVGHLVLTDYSPTLAVSTNVSPSVGHLILTGKQPAIAKSLSPSVGHLVLGGKVPTIAKSLASSVGHIVLTGKSPAVALTVNVAPSKGGLLLSGHQPVVGLPTAVLPSTGHVLLTGKQPSVLLTTRPVAGHISLGGKTPAVGTIKPLYPRQGHLSITGGRPFVEFNAWYPETDPSGSWADETTTGTWTPEPANTGTWTNEAEPGGVWTDEAPATGTWS